MRPAHPVQRFVRSSPPDIGAPQVARSPVESEAAAHRMRPKVGAQPLVAPVGGAPGRRERARPPIGCAT
eukprot:5933834-Pyramimonas_sp.AAC.1